MRWNKEALLQRQFRITGIAVAVSLCFLVARPAEDKQLTIITPQSSFSVLLQEREGKEYVDLQNILDQLGHTSATIEGDNFNLRYDRLEAHFKSGQTSGKVGNTSVQLAGKFLLENDHGLVPFASLVELLPHFTGGPAEYHEISRRLFVNGGGDQCFPQLKKRKPSTPALSFQASPQPPRTPQRRQLPPALHHDH